MERYDIIIIGITVSFAGKPSTKAIIITPSRPMALPNGSKKSVQYESSELSAIKLPETAKNAIADACTGSNPRQPSQEEMEKLLKACYYDLEIDF